MKVRVLYSGGQDSSLAAVLLEPFFEVELVTCSFAPIAGAETGKAPRGAASMGDCGMRKPGEQEAPKPGEQEAPKPGEQEPWTHARGAARALGFPFRRITLDSGVLEGCIGRILEHGYPRHGINYVHLKALEAVAAEGGYVADGTRRDDKAPALTMPEIKSLEMRTGARYIRPLAGYGRHAIDALVRRHFEVVEGAAIDKSDYESGIRSSIAETYGKETVRRLFPQEHPQSRVIRRLQK